MKSHWESSLASQLVQKGRPCHCASVMDSLLQNNTDIQCVLQISIGEFFPCQLSHQSINEMVLHAGCVSFREVCQGVVSGGQHKAWQVVYGSCNGCVAFYNHSTMQTCHHVSAQHQTNPRRVLMCGLHRLFRQSKTHFANAWTDEHKQLTNAGWALIQGRHVHALQKEDKNKCLRSLTRAFSCKTRIEPDAYVGQNKPFATDSEHCNAHNTCLQQTSQLSATSHPNQTKYTTLLQQNRLS